MTDITDLTELPAISADPLQITIDYSAPVQFLSEPQQHKQLLVEHQVIPRTNDYKPTEFKKVRQLNAVVEQIYYNVPELRHGLGVELWTTKFLKNDIQKNRSLEQFDPLKGNGLKITKFRDVEYMVFSAGPSLSSLVISSMDNNMTTIQYSKDLKYPIRQISCSPLSTNTLLIILVRTTSSIHLFQMDDGPDIISLVDEINFPQLSSFNSLVDYSMPVHAEMSPFSEYDYLFVTNNGYVALFDGAKHKIKFENVEPIPENTDYQSRWRSCGFGITQSSIYYVSPHTIDTHTFRDSVIVKKTLINSTQRIVGFHTVGSFYCYATTETVEIMDILTPERPLFVCYHHMRGSPPTELSLDQMKDGQWRLTAFSPLTQRSTLIFFEYDKNLIHSVKINATYQFDLSQFQFEELYNYTNRIYSAGFCIVGDNKGMSRIYRLFEDGSIRVQFLKFGSDQSQTPPLDCTWDSSNDHFSKLVDTAAHLLPEKHRQVTYNEVLHVNPINYTQYLDEVIAGSEKISDAKKRETAERLADLKSSTPIRDLIQDYEHHELQDLLEFQDQMVLHEDIQLLRQVSVPGISRRSPNTRLNRAHDKLISLSRTCIRPLPSTEEEHTKFQYVNAPFVSTTMTKALAELWTVGETKGFSSIQPDHVLKPEKFLSCQSRRKRMEEESRVKEVEVVEEVETEGIPVLARSLDISRPEPKATSSANYAFTSTQPLPGVFGSRKKKPSSGAPKKKAKKSSGFK